MPDVPLPWLLAGFAGAQLVLVAAKIVLVAGWLDGEQGRWLEAAVSALLLGALAVLAGPRFGTAGAVMLATVAALVQLGLSLAGPAVAALFDVGDEDEPLPPDYPPLAALILALVALGLPGSPFEEVRAVYVGALVATVAAFALWTAQRERAGDDDPVAAVSLYLAGAAIGGGAYLAAAASVGPGRALIVASLLVGLTSALQLILAFFTARLLELGLWDPVDTTRVCTVHGGVGMLIVGALFAGRFV